MKQTKKLLMILRKLKIVLLLIILTGCVQNTLKNSYCLIYEPIWWYEFEVLENQADKVENIRQQIDKNNLSYEILCGGLK